VEAPEIGNDDPLSDDHRRYLEALRHYLDMYPEMRNVTE
jgi:hypothetical protein